MEEEMMSADSFRQIAAEIEAQVGQVIVGQAELVRHTLVTLLAGRQRPAGRRARAGQNHAGAHPGPGDRLRLLAHPVHART